MPLKAEQVLPRAWSKQENFTVLGKLKGSSLVSLGDEVWIISLVIIQTSPAVYNLEKSSR